MKDLFFWKYWDKNQKFVFLPFLSLAFCSSLFWIAGWILGQDITLSWTTSPEFNAVYTPIDHFVQHLLQYTIDVNSFLVRESFAVGSPQIYPLSSYLYLALVIIGFLSLLTSVTFQDTVQFTLGMAFFLLFLVTLQTELLGIFGLKNRAFLFLAIFLYLPLGYYFQTFNKEYDYFRRFAAFLTLTIVLGVIPAFTSTAPAPYFHIANFSTPVPIVIALLFMALTAYDLIQLFLYLVTNSKSSNPSGRLLNFILISVLYLSNLFMALAARLGYLSDDLLFINPFIIYLFGSIAGLWIFKRKLQGTSMRFNPVGAFYYIGCMLISNAVIGLAFITDNDPMIEMFNYGIIYTYSAFGLIFLFYVLINFGDLFSKNVPIYKVVYQPRRSPYFIMQGISAVIVLALTLQANRFPYFMGVAGYYNLCGDLYTHINDHTLAVEYYKNGYHYAFQNHKSNYSLGALALAQGDQRTAQERFTQALARNPSPQAYIQLSNIYKEASMFFPSLFMLQDGIEEFPGNKYIANNLGLLSEKAGSVDSAFIYLDQATENDKIKSIAAGNMLALLIDRKLVKEADSVSRSFKDAPGTGFLSNELLARLLNHENWEKQIPARLYEDSLLTGSGFSFWYNYGLSEARTPGNNVTTHLEKLSRILENQHYRKHLETMIALNKWFTGSKFDALRQLDILRSLNFETAPYYNKLAGMLLFRQRSYHNALEFLKEAHREVDQEAMLYYAIALIETDQTKEGLEWLKKLRESELEDIKAVAINLSLVLNTQDIDEAKNWDDALKYQYLHFKIGNLSENERFRLFEEIRDENIRILAISELMKDYLNRGMVAEARRLFNLPGISSDNDNWYSKELNLQYLRLLTDEQQWEELSSASKKTRLNDYVKDDVKLFEAIASSQLGDAENAEKLFEEGLVRNPFNATMNLYAADFYKRIGKDEKAYDILVTGLELDPKNTRLLKAYIQMALHLNLDTFAGDALEELQKLLPASDFKAFTSAMEKRDTKNDTDENIY